MATRINIYVKWASIWEQVRQSSPNLIAEGPDSEKFSQIEPGATVTVSGMYTPEQRCFEIMSVDLGDNRYQRNGQHHEIRASFTISSNARISRLRARPPTR